MKNAGIINPNITDALYLALFLYTLPNKPLSPQKINSCCLPFAFSFNFFLCGSIFLCLVAFMIDDHFILISLHFLFRILKWICKQWIGVIELVRPNLFMFTGFQQLYLWRYDSGHIWKYVCSSLLLILI